MTSLPPAPAASPLPAPPLLHPDHQVAEFTVRGRAHRLLIPRGSMDDCRAIFEGREYPVGLFRHAGVTTILDIGAHVGFASLYFHLQFPDACIHAFEPLAENQDLFRANLADVLQVRLHPHGLGAGDETRTLYLSRQFGLGASSVVRTRDHEGESALVELRDARKTIGGLVPPGNPVSILKIDTEGFEFVVLDRLREWLPAVDVVFLEVHSERRRRDIDRLLAPWFQLRHCEVPFGHRIKLLYLNARALQEGRVATVNAPEILI
ncbi:MAG: FkbM family methyltransferase [Opitutaceae bacterium]|nr:FkbM family methyltransferase [Opitutaceae bacterium]